MIPITETFDALKQPIEGTHSIEASAGTGKTYSITLLWLRLLIERELAIDQILVSTFTKAATAELKDRLLAALRAALSAAQQLQLGNSINAGPEAQIVQASKLAKNAEWRRLVLLINDALSSFDLAPICTIHSFCQSLISRYSVELGCDSGLTLIEDHAEILNPIVDDQIMHLTDKHAPDVKGLRNAAKVVASQSNARLLVATPASPENIEALRKQILTEAPEALTKLRAGPSLKTASKVIELFRSEQKWTPFTKSAQEKFPAHFTALWNEYRNMLKQESLVSFGEFAQRIKTEFPLAKLQAGVRSFDDIVLTVQSALETQGPDGALAKSVCSRLRAAIIDECQDSDAIQISVFERLFCHQDTVSFIVIGDPKQSIYRFRGADLASYKRLAANAHPASPMRCNYRSDKPLIDSLNNLYTSSYVFPDALTSHSKTAYIPVRSQHDSRIQDSKNLPAMIFQWSEQSSRRSAQQEIAEMVAHECSRLISEGVHVEDRHSGHMRPLRFGDIAVLCYGHHELKIVRRALTHLGISCQSSGAGLGSVFESPEADDVHAWLQLLSAINSHGSVLGKLLAFEGTPLGCSETNRFQSNGNGPGEQAAQLAVFQREAEIMQRFGPLPSMLKRLDQREVIKRNLGYAEGERRYTNWRHLASLLQLEHARGRRGPQALGQWLARNIAGGDRTGSIETGASNSVLMKLETDSSAVQMVTVHGSKGLEYPVVFCPFLWQLRSKKERLRKQTALLRMTNEWCVDVGSAKFVEHLNKGIEQEDEEEHRKLYVALTRARHRLYIGMAPVTESGTNQNGAARSPIAALPGLNLANTELSLWRQALERIEGCAVHDRTGLSVASSRLAKQHGTHAWDDPHTLKPPQELRPYAFLIKRTASFTSLSKSEQDCEGAADRDFEKAEPKPQSGPDLLSELGQAGAALGDRLHAVLEDYLGNLADMSEAVAECNPPDAWKNAIETIVRTPLSFGAHKPISLDEVREGCITEMQFHLPILTLNPKTLSSALLEDPGIRANKERSQWANQISDNWPFSEFGGYLQGYIDLIFEHENRWFLVDYKSNKLDDYTPATLESMMLEKHYLLQARLYALALHRHLQVQMPGYNHSEHFGGVGYLFVRGLPVEGLWFERPCLESLQSLGTLFTFNQK